MGGHFAKDAAERANPKWIVSRHGHVVLATFCGR